MYLSKLKSAVIMAIQEEWRTTKMGRQLCSKGQNGTSNHTTFVPLPTEHLSRLQNLQKESLAHIQILLDCKPINDK